MTTQVPAKKNAAHVFYCSLLSQSNTKVLQANPTLAAGDVKVAVDDGAPANITTLPTVDADFTKRLKVELTSGEMNGDNITLIFSDAAGDEWCDLIVNIPTSARQIDDLAFPATSGRSITVDASGNANANLVNIAGAAVATGTAQLGVNVVQAAGTAWGSGAITAASIAADAIGASELAADAATEIATAVWAAAARTLTALDEDTTTLDLDATIRAAIGMSSANLDTQLTTIDDFLDTEIAAIKAKTDNLPSDPADQSLVIAATDAIVAAIGALNNLSAAQVNAQVLDVLTVDTFAQPGQATPPATTSMLVMLGYLYKFLRNKRVQTSSELRLFNDDGSTVDQKQSVTDDGSELTVAEMVTGP